MAESPSARARRAALKTRAAVARAAARAASAWAKEVSSANSGTLWRCTSTWIEERDGSHCADFTHASSGARRTVRLAGFDSVDGRATELLRQLAL